MALDVQFALQLPPDRMLVHVPLPEAGSQEPPFVGVAGAVAQGFTAEQNKQRCVADMYKHSITVSHTGQSLLLVDGGMQSMAQH